MTYKKFSYILIGIAAILALMNIAFWHMVTKEVFYENDGHGDLVRLASFPLNTPVTKNISYEAKHEELKDYIRSGSQEQFPVLVIGDSFSCGGGGGYYQDYMAEKYGIRSINVPCTNRFQYWDQVHLLGELGYLDQIRPKVVILECVERGIVWGRLNQSEKPPHVSKSVYEEDCLKYRHRTGREQVPPYALLTTVMGAANWKYINDRIYAREHEDAFSPEVKKALLDKPLFSNPGQEQLLLYHEHERSFEVIPPNIDYVNDTVNQLARYLSDRGIRLILLVPPDKYDLYYPYISDTAGMKKETFFEDIRSLPKEYAFLDLKELLGKELASGTQDIYWSDDTHWSWKAYQLVVDDLVQYLRD